MKLKYKCTYTARMGAPCPIMCSHNKPHPDHCHAYDCSIWRVNPKLTCKHCVPLEEGEKPEEKIWCGEMDMCDSYNDGGIEHCKNCFAKTIVFNPAKKKNKIVDKNSDVLDELISRFAEYKEQSLNQFTAADIRQKLQAKKVELHLRQQQGKP